jgi:hypothetical protein
MTLDLDDLGISTTKDNNGHYHFFYQQKEYIYKDCKNLESCYNELIAKKIADKLSIPCCDYIFTYYRGNVGVSSELFDITNYISIKDMLKETYGEVPIEINNIKYIDDEFRSKNNLESNWFALEKKYFEYENRQEIVERLMNQIVKIELFDFLIGNSDRHTDNYGIINEEEIHISQIFDNEEMLSEYALYEGYYSIQVTEEDYIEIENNKSNPINIFEKFFETSSTEYQKEFEKMLDVITDESIDEIFNELKDDGVFINEVIKEKIKKKFKIHREIIERFINSKKILKKKIGE